MERKTQTLTRKLTPWAANLLLSAGLAGAWSLAAVPVTGSVICLPQACCGYTQGCPKVCTNNLVVGDSIEVQGEDCQTCQGSASYPYGCVADSSVRVDCGVQYFYYGSGCDASEQFGTEQLTETGCGAGSYGCGLIA